MITSDTPNAAGAPSQAQQPTTPPPAQPSRRYRMIFGGTLAVVTLVALVVAYAASDFRPSSANAVPSTWKQVYSADLTGVDYSAWNQTETCHLDALGLDASGTTTSDALCVFIPSVKSTVTSSGFYFETTLVPASKILAFVRSTVSVGDVTGKGSVITFTVGQDGAYTLCENACVSPSDGIYLHGGLAAWHSNALLANTIAMKVSPDHSTLTVYVNGQQVASVSSQLGAQPAIAVGAPAGSEAIFTSASLYTGQ